MAGFIMRPQNDATVRGAGAAERTRPPLRPDQAERIREQGRRSDRAHIETQMIASLRAWQAFVEELSRQSA